MTSLAETAAEHRRTARRERRRARKAAQDAADWYESAKSQYELLDWVTQRPELWPDLRPHVLEDIANLYVKFGDQYLRQFFNSSRHSAFYFQLARDYERMLRNVTSPA